METKVIKGTINFEITLSETEGIKVDYNSSPDNEIGALAISEMILSDVANYYTHLRNTTTGKDKAAKEKLKLFTNTANVLKKGRTGLARILNMLLNNYDGIIEEQRLKQEKAEEVKKYLEEKGITLESGVMSEEEVKKIINERGKYVAGIDPYDKDSESKSMGNSNL